ncbi:hypothetical protein N0V90_007940 [Kalmusia sp. IMI 367209]|nr:hypothetical protein N0V90_007940 [Kalmusia sp. IMI 367209]
MFPRLLTREGNFRTEGAGHCSSGCDFVYAGLGLIQPDSLDINLELKNPFSLPPRNASNNPDGDRRDEMNHPNTLTKRRLWQSLRADIPAETPEVLLNLAACLLSQQGGIELLSISSRLRDPAKIRAKNLKEELSDPSISKLPSWVPNPSSWTSRLIDHFATLGEVRYYACTQLTNTPKISADGTTLYLDAAQIDTVKIIKSLRTESDSATVLSVMQFIELLLELPNPYPATGSSLIRVMASVVIAGLWGDTYPPANEIVIALIYYLHSAVNYKIGNIESSKRWTSSRISTFQHEIRQKQNEEAELRKQPWIVQKMTYLHEQCEQNIGALFEDNDRRKTVQELEISIKRQEDNIREQDLEMENLIATWESAKKAFPNEPWPELSDKLGESARKLGNKYEEILRSTMRWRNVFITEKGLLGICPSWTKKGDALMLVKGGYVPYLFTHIDEDMRHKLEAYQTAIGSPDIPESAKSRLQREIMKLQENFGAIDAWVLTGEAYVEGVMEGEAVDGQEFGRIAIV